MTTESHRSTEQTIIEAGFSVLSRNPGANVAEVAREAGITRATLHRYFPSRKNLIEALARRAVNEMNEAVEAACKDVTSAGEGLERAMFALIPLGNRHGFVAHEQLDHGDAVNSAFVRIQEETADWIEAAKREGMFNPHVPTAWIAQAYDYLLYSAWASIRAGDTTTEQAANLAWRTLTQGLGGDIDSV